MGYMHKWDLSLLIAKLEEVKVREKKTTYKATGNDIIDDTTTNMA